MKSEEFKNMDNERSNTRGRKTGSRKSKSRSNRSNNNKPAYSKNAPEWYGSDQAILRDYASYPFSFATGTPIKMNDPILQLISKDSDELVIPGVTIQWLVPTIGHTERPSDPANIAMNSLYSAIRSANSGAKNYDAPDQFLYCLAVSQVYAYINWMQRIYGIATTLYSQGNRYMPQKLLEAEGIDYTSIRDNVSNFRGAINIMINKIASFAVPNTLTLFKRTAFLYQGIYSEGTSIKDQLYMYSPASFYKFQLDTDSKGMLTTVASPSSRALCNNQLASAQQLISFGNELIDALFSDEDVQIIGGDILKAFGRENLIMLNSLPEVYPIIPVFSVEVLEQMANATVLHDSLIGVANRTILLNSNITQVVEDLTSSPYLKCPNALQMTTSGDPTSVDVMQAIAYTGLTQSKFLTTTTDKTGPDLVIVNSRLMLTASDVNREAANVTMYIESGTEIVWAQCYVTMGYNSTGSLKLERYWTSFVQPIKVDNDTTGLANSFGNMIRSLSVRNFFKFNSPIMQYLYKDGTSSPSVSIANGYLNQAIDNATLLHDGDLRNLHQVAILNLLHVPPVAKH